MITDEQVRRTALFFLLTLMEEKAAIAAAHRTIADIKAQQPRGNEVANAILVRELWQKLLIYRKQISRHVTHAASFAHWHFPEEIDFQPWSKFQREAAETEVAAVVLVRVLNFTELEIGAGLEIPQGTVHYRLGKGVRQLGAHVLKARNTAAKQ